MERSSSAFVYCVLMPSDCTCSFHHSDIRVWVQKNTKSHVKALNQTIQNYTQRNEIIFGSDVGRSALQDTRFVIM